ncbi:MAG: class I SAM-dependent methyltransferase [Chthoniobacter sp.]|nr:class I SAM-dependent methyltransferase [Chthoniobacter sp.]
MPNRSEIESSIERVGAHWNKKAIESATDCARVDASLRAQRMRFEAFLLHHDLQGKSVLDVGCGVGDFWAHLQARGVQCEYLGVDIAPQMIQRSRERYPQAEFAELNILEWEPGRVFDYVVAFGIHSVKVPNKLELFRLLTRRKYELCFVAAHTAVLTDRYSHFGPEAQTCNPEESLTVALAITPYVVLRHDYLPNDFSLTLYRQPLIDTRAGLLLD